LLPIIEAITNDKKNLISVDIWYWIDLEW
jgi:hypothetical protein